MQLIKKESDKTNDVLKEKKEEICQLKMTLGELVVIKTDQEKVIYELRNQFSQKEQELLKLQGEKDEQIAMQSQLLTAQAQTVSCLEQQLKDATSQMPNDKVMINGELLEIDDITKQLEATKAEVSNCSYYSE